MTTKPYRKPTEKEKLGANYLYWCDEKDRWVVTPAFSNYLWQAGSDFLYQWTGVDGERGQV